MTELLISHIVSDPDKRGGRPRIKDTGITVQDVAEDYQSGWSAERIAEEFNLTPSQVHAALSYYFDHKTEIDHAIRETQTQVEAFIDQHGEGVTMQEIKRRMEERKP